MNKIKLLRIIEEESTRVIAERRQPSLYKIYTWDRIRNQNPPTSFGQSGPRNPRYPSDAILKGNIKPLYAVSILGQHHGSVLGIKPLLNLYHKDFPKDFRAMHTGKDKMLDGHIVITLDDKRIGDIMKTPEELNALDGYGALPKDAYGRAEDQEAFRAASEASKRWLAQQESKEGPPEEFVPKLKATGNEPPEPDPMTQRMTLNTRYLKDQPKRFVPDLTTLGDTR